MSAAHTLRVPEGTTYTGQSHDWWSNLLSAWTAHCFLDHIHDWRNWEVGSRRWSGTSHDTGHWSLSLLWVFSPLYLMTPPPAVWHICPWRDIVNVFSPLYLMTPPPAVWYVCPWRDASVSTSGTLFAMLSGATHSADPESMNALNQPDPLTWWTPLLSPPGEGDLSTKCDWNCNEPKTWISKFWHVFEW